MYKRIFCSSILLSLCIIAFSKELMYPVSEIPAALLQNAHTVMRVYKQEVEIKSERSAVVSVTEVRTILNKNGENDAYFSETYDPMNKISNVKGKVYNELGKQIKSLGGDDVVDHSAISGFSLYEDNRVKYIDPKNLTYPFTVEYTYDIDLKHTFFLPVWSHGSENTSYENSIFIVKTPVGYSFRYKEYNLPKGVVKTTQDDKDVYTWTITNLSARIDEPMTIKSLPTYPLVRLAPNKFEVGETKGSSETWKDLGIWMTGLLDKKDILSESTKAKMKEITSSCKNDLEKVKVVYQYMQQKTRYVSIQVGIGGWQPFDAETVDKTSYGDCKALSNYTKALLLAVGVKSYYALVYAGASSRNIDADFASNQFNHAIVFVPIDKDSV
jgi:transglutaminase-like putative cysteine protease